MAMYALGHLRSYIFAAIMNARIVFAAILSTALLKKRMHTQQWCAIIVVACAATFLCLQVGKAGFGPFLKEPTGTTIAIGAAVASSAGGVLMEKYLNLPDNSIYRPAIHLPPSHLQPQALPFLLAFSSTQSRETPLSRPNGTEVPLWLLWEQQGVLALFSAGFADLYILLFHSQAIRERRLLEGWTPMTAIIMFMQALQGILVAITIQRCGIVFRLILGTTSLCFNIVLECLIFLEPIVLQEALCIILVLVGTYLYSTAANTYTSLAQEICDLVNDRKERF